jgi:AcrR family transcriptional regulator
MGIAERKKRERERRRKEILDAAESLFFSYGYENVSMDRIADAVELNKATLYLYFRNKETLLAAVALRGVQILNRMYQECAKKQIPGMDKVALMGDTYYLFTRQYPDYVRIFRYYSLDLLSKDNPCSDEIEKTFMECRRLLCDAVREGMEDGTIRNDIDPFLLTVYIMVTSMSIFSLTDKWKSILEQEGFSYDALIGEYRAFITPAVVSGEKPRASGPED